jgi:hypothetical protein
VAAVTALDGYPGGWFGASWGAPVCDKESHLDTPVGERCIDCLELLTDADRGLSVPFVYEIGSMTLTHHHHACFVRNLGIGR